MWCLLPSCGITDQDIDDTGVCEVRGVSRWILVAMALSSVQHHEYHRLRPVDLGQARLEVGEHLVLGPLCDLELAEEAKTVSSKVVELSEE